MKFQNFWIRMFVWVGVLFLSVSSVCAKTAQEYFTSGRGYYNQGKFTRAISDHTKAIETNPDYADAYYLRGSSYYRQGNMTQSIPDFNKAMR